MKREMPSSLAAADARPRYQWETQRRSMRSSSTPKLTAAPSRRLRDGSRVQSVLEGMSAAVPRVRLSHGLRPARALRSELSRRHFRRRRHRCQRRGPRALGPRAAGSHAAAARGLPGGLCLRHAQQRHQDRVQLRLGDRAVGRGRARGTVGGLCRLRAPRSEEACLSCGAVQRRPLRPHRSGLRRACGARGRLGPAGTGGRGPSGGLPALPGLPARQSALMPVWTIQRTSE